MSLDKSKISMFGDSSRNLILKKERNTRNDPFVEITQKSQKQEGGTKSHKISKDKLTTLEVEIHRRPAHDEVQRNVEPS